MSSSKDIVIVGASFAGLGVAHSLLKHTLPALKKAQPSTSYRVVLIDRSSHFYWRIGGPRALVSTELIPHSESFTPITDGFKNYPSESFIFRQGTAQSIDTAARTVSVKLAPSGEVEAIPYHALIIASGISTPTNLTSLLGDYTESQSALDEMNKRVASAKEIVVSGGGPVAVEVAGEIGEALNGAAGWFQSRPANPKAKITVVAGGKKLLPVLRQSISDKAEKFLNRLGVDVLYNTRVESVEEPASKDGKTIIHLSDGSILEADVYIPGTGTVPNSSFIPPELLDEHKKVNTDDHLRVRGAGERVYAAGDVGSHTPGGALHIPPSLPIVAANIGYDLSDGATGPEKIFKPDTSESQIVPVGRNKGVGAFKGVQTPSVMVWGIKGRNYMLNMKAGYTHGTAV